MQDSELILIEEKLEKIWESRFDPLETSMETLRSMGENMSLRDHATVGGMIMALEAYFSLYKGAYSESRELASKGIEVLGGKERWEASAYKVAARLHHILGIVEMATSHFGESILHYKEALTYCDIEPQLDLKVLILMNLGELYRGALDENEKALPFYEEALSVTEETQHPMAEVIQSTHKLCLIRLGKTDGMLEALKDLQGQIPTLSTHKSRAGVCQTVAQGYRELGYNQEALSLVDYGLNTFNSSQDHFLKLNLQLIGAQALANLGQFEKALEYAVAVIKSEGMHPTNTLFLNLYKLMGRCYGELGDFTNQAKYLGLALLRMETEMSDHIERHTSVLAAEMKQKSLEKDLEIHRLKNIELKEQSERLEQTALELQAALEDLMTAQDRLVKTEKLAALGELVAGVSHEINTPLGTGITLASYISDHIQELSLKLKALSPAEAEIQIKIEEIAGAVAVLNTSLRRTADIVNSFKQVVMDQSSYERRTFNIYDYLSDLLVMLGAQYDRTKFHVSIVCDKNIEVSSFPGAFAQVVNQLMMNALTHGFKNKDSGEIRINIQLKGPQMVLRISNNGHPIKLEDKEKIFNPFYTTNRGGRNIGLGLHMLHNLVDQVLKGRIGFGEEAKDGESIWTFFEVVWPVSAPEQINSEV